MACTHQPDYECHQDQSYQECAQQGRPQLDALALQLLDLPHPLYREAAARKGTHFAICNNCTIEDVHLSQTLPPYLEAS